MESMQIVHLATRCTTLFKEHSQSYGISSTEGLESVKQIMETQSARLNLWADNNGEFATFHRSDH